MKKLIAVGAIGLSMLATTPAFAQEVKSGDTMSKIAKENNMSLGELQGLNPQVKDINKIYVGQNINTEKTGVKSSEKSTAAITGTGNVSSSEKDLLSRLVRAEAENEPYSGKVAVATVVLNRVDSSEFPNSISSVINQSGQFSPVSNGQINKPADADSIKAVNEALTFNRNLGAGSLFFYNPKTATSHWLDSRPTTITIGNHVFKK
ncbi:cell wall hydrolase [Priestia aryabhattai]|uniref:cell wall hydrolase n=1 Tax=Priestia aryabhattai TaxID=412384 RepID=UPI0020401106|nr:cell wall hydrolase [Priestia aryabhattai]MCM3639680.1 cell wall hydrolase [Priestia aryabhattai]